MLTIFDRAAMAQMLTKDIEPQLHSLLDQRFAVLLTAEGDLAEWTEYVVVEPGDSEADLIGAVGFSPLVDPIDGRRFGDPAFRPHWAYLADLGGWFEMIITSGSTFAYVFLIKDADGVLHELRRMCQEYAA
ncbi:hypothetical protein [Novosphingobium sp. Leaf2]|uniref:hypothetical protein n=1 Tax=Novosphingobium sp. Leaf2 TaxID=1735670 RepID=UPI0006F22685|nr:hypothetical protein [Novosphingobium sp. Leaf2]KQM13898.1 hypothetical protein ASE49_12760 [Novosphingobium sp. Leaf2]